MRTAELVLAIWGAGWLALTVAVILGGLFASTVDAYIQRHVSAALDENDEPETVADEAQHFLEAHASHFYDADRLRWWWDG
jgi:hypothetical protein